MDYPYVGLGRLSRRKPYSFSPFGGSAFLEAHAARRESFGEELRRTGALHRFEREVGPSVECVEIEDRCGILDGALESAWRDELAACGSVATADWLERIVCDHRRETLPLAGDERWSVRVVRRWVERFEAFGCVHARYDRQGRRVERDPNRPDVVVRLAAATAQAGSDADDVATATIHLNALLKANDLVDAQWHHVGGERSTTDADFALMALELESVLLDRVARHAAAVQRTKEAGA